MGGGQIKLVILGQDPTVKNAKSRAAIRTVLNLDKEGSLKRYIEGIARGLGLELARNVYATNLLKPFFLSPPASALDDSQLRDLADIWTPVLIEEIGEISPPPPGYPWPAPVENAHSPRSIDAGEALLGVYNELEAWGHRADDAPAL